MTEASEEQIAALQCRARLAGNEMRVLHGQQCRRFFRFLFAPVLGLGLVCLLVSLLQDVLPPRWSFGILLTLVPFYLLMMLLMGAGAVLDLIRRARRRSRLRKELRRQLSGLPAGEAHAVLAPLREDPLNETRWIVAPLIRGFRGIREVASADPAPGRGDEPTP